MSTRSEVIARLKGIEAGQLGQGEHPPGSNNNKYNTSYYGHPVHDDDGTFAWCVVFQWWCFQKAGIPTSIFPKTAGVAAVMQWFRNRGRFYSDPMAGDLVIYLFHTNDGKHHHIALVEKVISGGRIQTLEGNSGQNNVARRKGPAHSPSILGYCRPEYHKVVTRTGGGGGPAPHQQTSDDTEDIVNALPLLKRGANGDDVRRLQGLLTANGHMPANSLTHDNKFDGQFGQHTEDALKAATGATIANNAQWKKLLGV